MSRIIMKGSEIVYKVLGVSIGVNLINSLKVNKPNITIVNVGNVSSSSSKNIDETRKLESEVKGDNESARWIDGVLKVFLGRSIYIRSTRELIIDGIFLEKVDYQEQLLDLDYFWWSANEELFKEWIDDNNVIDIYKNEIYYIEQFVKTFKFNSTGVSVNKSNFASIVSFFNDKQIKAQIIRNVLIHYQDLDPEIGSKSKNMINKMKRSIIAYFSLAFSAFLRILQILRIQSERDRMNFNNILEILKLDSLDVHQTIKVPVASKEKKRRKDDCDFK
jgi:hypothetical protein